VEPLSTFNVQHALDCALGGFRTIQHNEVRDVLAQCMREAGHHVVETEPQLQPLDGEVFEYKSANKDDDARRVFGATGRESSTLSTVISILLFSLPPARWLLNVR